MGSPLGPVLSNIFLGYFEKKYSAQIRSLSHLYTRYVDDTFICTSSQTQLQQLFDLLNSFHANLCFTKEHEVNNRLPFLDVLVIRRSDGSTATTMYRKATWKGLYTCFSSFVPFSYKRGLIQTLFYRVYHICTPDYLDDEKQFIMDTLMKLGYPPRLIEKYSALLAEKQQVYGPPKPSVYVKIPYTGDTSFKKANLQIRNKVALSFPQVDVRVVGVTRPIWKKSLKDITAKSDQSSIIYKFSCMCGGTYIGKTQRTLNTRVKEHVPRYITTDSPDSISKRRPASSIARHLIQCQHKDSADISSFEVLAQGRSYSHLGILEALFIKRHNPSICVQKDTTFSLLLSW